jgi:anaerobic nitric oxide reductase transcription regulator
MANDLPVLLEVALDLTRSLVASDRYQRLVTAVRRAIPCDAAALLRLEGDSFVPLATHGLVPETLGLRFRLADHPRLEIISRSEEPILFPEDSTLPDPFDGLIAGESHALQDVHSCLGCPLRVDGQLVGALTADALRPGAFRDLAADELSFLGALAGAALRTHHLIEITESMARHQGFVARDLMREKLHRSGDLIGRSAAMERLRADIQLVARSDLSVLVFGETGTGKELVAQAIHDASPRRAAPLIQVNCAALPEAVAESELFGHVRGAFTGADRDRPGKFEVARGGTLLLDEVGELPLSLQPKLLRALQEGEIQRVGSDATIRVDTRIIAATNRDLAREVEEGRFRADLFHRINVFPLAVPPLRDRREDIPLLAGFFCDRIRRQLGTGPVRLTPDARSALQEFDWPGNVRELDNVVSRLVLRASRNTERDAPIILDAPLVRPEVTPEGRRPAKTRPAATDAPLKDQVDAFKRTVIQEALDAADGNWAAAARHLGVHRSNLHAVAQRLGLA